MKGEVKVRERDRTVRIYEAAGIIGIIVEDERVESPRERTEARALFDLGEAEDRKSVEKLVAYLAAALAED